MRFRKKRGTGRKKMAAVTMTESEIVEACHEYLERKGVEVGNICWIKINVGESRKRGDRVQFVAELEQDHE